MLKSANHLDLNIKPTLDRLVIGQNILDLKKFNTVNLFLKYLFLLLFVICLGTGPSWAQRQDTGILRSDIDKDSTLTIPTDSIPANKEVDLLDIVHRIFHPKQARRDESAVKDYSKPHFSVLPAVGYTLSTGLAGIISANVIFQNNASLHPNLSTILGNISYTEHRQTILQVQTNIWSRDNKYKWVGDARYLKYPALTYGLGGQSPSDSGYTVDYSYVRIYQTLLRALWKNVYAGFGYSLDYHWDIDEFLDQQHITDFQKYGLRSHSVSSGINFNFLFDNRRNPINANQGLFANIIYRLNLSALGSDNNYQTLIAEFRKYISVSADKRNVLAFWSYNWVTISGDPPYLDLPSTGWDGNNNSGRGYIQGRYRGKTFLYLESEYRLGISANGLIGAVFFVNAETVNDWPTNKFSLLAPGAGLGLRILLNKVSGSNIAIDYGFGLNGSRGLFVNLGEVF